jgi:hypothetical protein
MGRCSRSEDRAPSSARQPSACTVALPSGHVRRSDPALRRYEPGNIECFYDVSGTRREPRVADRADRVRIFSTVVGRSLREIRRCARHSRRRAPPTAPSADPDVRRVHERASHVFLRVFESTYVSGSVHSTSEKRMNAGSKFAVRA